MSLLLKEPEGWSGISLMEVFRVVYLGKEEVMPNQQLGWIKIIPDDGRVQYLYNVQKVDESMKPIESLQDLVLTVKGPTASFKEVKLEFNLFCGAFKGCESLQWEPYPSDVLLEERRLASKDSTALICVTMGLFGNATVANLELKLNHYSAATNVYGLVVASNSKLDQHRSRSMLFLKNHDNATKVGNDGVIPLSKSRVGVPLGSMLYVDISLFCDGKHNAYTLCFEALLTGETAKSAPTEENADIQVTVTWDADEDSIFAEVYDEDSDFSATYDEDSNSLVYDKKFSVYDKGSDFSACYEDSDFSEDSDYPVMMETQVEVK